MTPLTSQQQHQVVVAKYLLPGEDCMAMVRRHPAVLIVPSLQAVGGLLAAALLSVTVPSVLHLLSDVVWIICALLIARLIWKAANWYLDFFVITTKRILLTSGVFTRSVAMMPLTKVTDMTFRKSFAGRLFGYGNFVVESAGKDAVLGVIDHIPYPEQLYQVVCKGVFPDAAKPKAPEPEPEPQPDLDLDSDLDLDLDEFDTDVDDEYDDLYNYDGGPDQPIEL
jgi:membrane protein YdbS with pleckstrin-like domain